MGRLALVLAGLGLVWVSAAAGGAKGGLAAALRGTQASGVVVDGKTGAVVESFGRMSRATPGSTLKPLLLEYALEHGVVTARTQVMCHRTLRIGGRAMGCTHPASEDVFTAESALAESCNTYFAELGRRFTGEGLEAALRQARVAHEDVSGMGVEGRELAILGLEGVTATPLELAQAYRGLALGMPGDGPVARGMRGSVEYGMARGAATGGLEVLGKTGTARNPGEGWTHGWFAGIVSGRGVLVVYVPHGDGGTAAELAHRVLAGDVAAWAK